MYSSNIVSFNTFMIKLNINCGSPSVERHPNVSICEHRAAPSRNV